MTDIEHFPIFDAHMHFSHAYLDQVMDSYARCGVKAGVNIWWTHHLDFGEYLRTLGPKRLRTWTAVYWPNWPQFGWRPQKFVKQLCADMRTYAKMGCRGLKVWKDLGMFIVHPDGKPARMDDRRLEPVWETAAKLGWWVYVHQADPTASWKTRTGLSRDEIYQRRDVVLGRWRQIPWVLCHAGNDIENVKRFAETFDRFPHVISDFNRDFLLHNTLAETKAFFEKYADRLLFGPDSGMPDNRPPDHKWNWEEMYLPWRRRLASWGLSDAAFRKVTWENGQRLFLDA